MCSEVNQCLKSTMSPFANSGGFGGRGGGFGGGRGGGGYGGNSYGGGRGGTSCDFSVQKILLAAVYELPRQTYTNLVFSRMQVSEQEMVNCAF